MSLFVIFLVVFLQLPNFLSCSILDVHEHNKLKENKALAEHSQQQITTISKRGGGGGHGGGGGGHGGGGSAHGYGGGHGGEEGARGRDGSVIGVAGGAAAATAARGREGRNGHQRGSTTPNAQLGLTLPSVLVGLGIYLVRF